MVRAFAIAGTAIAGGGIIGRLARFGQAMSTVRAVTAATADQFRRLTERARDLGARTRFAASQAADGMLYLARAGFRTDQVLASIGGTLQLAQAGALGLGRAADIASNILTGFRLEAKQTGRIVDVLALASNSANTSVEQMGEAMKFVAPVAAGLKVSVEEAAAAIGALSDAGLQGSLAGTGLRRVLSELESPSTKTRDLLRDLGISTEEARISQVGLTGALRRLAEAGVDTGLALEIFGDRGGPAFEVLANSIPKVVALTGALENAEGTAERMADTMDDNLNGALLRVASAFEAIILAAGELGGDSALTQFFNALAAALRALAENIDLVIYALGGLLLAFAIPRLLRVAGAMAGIGTSTGGVTAALGKATGAVKLFIRAFAFGYILQQLSDIVGALDRIGVSAENIATTDVRGIVDSLLDVYGTSNPLKRQETVAPEIFGGGIGEYLTDKDIRGRLEHLFTILHEKGERFTADFADDLIDKIRRKIPDFNRDLIHRLVDLPPITETLDVDPPERAAERLKLTSEQAEAYRELHDRLDPVAAALRKYREGEELLTLARKAGKITAEEEAELNERLYQSYKAQLNPLYAMYREISQQFELRRLGIGDREIEIELLQREQLLLSQGVRLSEKDRDVLRERIRERQTLDRELREEARAYELVKDPAEDYHRQVAALQRILQRGTPGLTLPDKFEDARGKVRAYGGDIEDTLTTAFQRSEHSMVGFLETGESRFRQFVDTINEEAGRLVLVGGWPSLNRPGRHGTVGSAPGSDVIRDDAWWLPNARDGMVGRYNKGLSDRIIERLNQAGPVPRIDPDAYSRRRSTEEETRRQQNELLRQHGPGVLPHIRGNDALLMNIADRTDSVPDLSLLDPETRATVERELWRARLRQKFRDTPAPPYPRGHYPFLGDAGENDIMLPRGTMPVHPPGLGLPRSDDLATLLRGFRNRFLGRFRGQEYVAPRSAPGGATGAGDPAEFLRSLDPAALERLRNKFPSLMREIERSIGQTGFAFQKSSMQVRDNSTALVEVVEPAQALTETMHELGNEMERNPELAERVAQAMIDLRLQYLGTQRSLDAGIERGFLRYSQDATNFANHAERAIGGAFRSAEDAVAQFATTGKVDFRGLINSMIADLARMTAQQTILGPLAGALASAFAGPVVQPYALTAGNPATSIGTAGGGFIRGPGTGTSDSITAMLPPGSYIVNARATARHRGVLDAIAGAPAFAGGGRVLSRISNGEYFISPGHAARYRSVLETINGSVPAFQGGGVVPPPAPGAGMVMAGGKTTVQIIDQRSSDDPPVEVESQPTGDGGEMIRVLIRRENRQAIEEGDYDGAFDRRYGIRPPIS